MAEPVVLSQKLKVVFMAKSAEGSAVDAAAIVMTFAAAKIAAKIVFSQEFTVISHYKNS